MLAQTSTHTRPPVLAVVDGWPINLATPAQSIEAAGVAAERREPFTLYTLNLDHLVKLRRDERFRAAYAAADLVTADGAPVAALARRQCPDVIRTTGADLVEPLARAAAERGYPVFLFGATDTVLGAARDRFIEQTGARIDVAGMEAPSQGFDPVGPEADAALDRIARSRARLCFVALGAPKQELFAARARERGVRCGFVCVGAALDFIAGTQRRAPALFQALNLEWMWRLASDPRRLTARYARCALLLGEMLVVGAPSIHSQPAEGGRK